MKGIVAREEQGKALSRVQVGKLLHDLRFKRPTRHAQNVSHSGPSPGRHACYELSLGVVGMQDFEAADLGAVRASLAKLERAAVYVGVFAYRYGFVPPGDSRSVTEQEFDRATELGLERLCFLLDPFFPWPPECMELGKLRRVEEFHRKVRDAGLVVDTFTTPDNLHHLVFLALQRWLERTGDRPRGPRQIPAPPAAGGPSSVTAARAAPRRRG